MMPRIPKTPKTPSDAADTSANAKQHLELGSPIAAETVLKGGRTNYYLVHVLYPQREEQAPYQAECEDIIDALELTFDEANIFKEIWRSANARKGNGKPNHSELYGAQKIVHYAGRRLRKYQRLVMAAGQWRRDTDPVSK